MLACPGCTRRGDCESCPTWLVESLPRRHVLADGDIVESGTHDDLLAHNGRYAALWKVQTGEVGGVGDVGIEMIGADAVGNRGAKTYG